MIIVLLIQFTGCVKTFESGPDPSFDDVDIDAIYESFDK